MSDVECIYCHKPGTHRVCDECFIRTGRIRYRVGSIIQYQSSREVRTVVVKKKYEEIPHHGRPGFDATMVDDEKVLVWGFTDDILMVLEY